MRDIQFRGKRIDNGEWVFGDYSRYSKDQSIIMVDLLEQEDYWVASETVGQYTGLKDKYGVEIYEGDILEGFSVYPTKDTFQSKTLGNVYYSNRGTWDCCSFLLGDINEQMEVIGNIYNNPELMGGR